MKFVIAALLGLLFSCSGISINDDGWDGSKVGPNRFTIAASISGTNADDGSGTDVDTTRQAIRGTYGRLIDGTALEPGIIFALAHATSDVGKSDSDAVALAVAGNLRYYFNTEAQIRPFVQGFGGIIFARSDTSETDPIDDAGPLLGGSLGLAAFMSHDVSFEVDATFQYWNLFDVDVTDLSLNLGITIHF